MDITARLYLCALCRTQTFIFSPCDRGNIYCSALCSETSRSTSCKAANQRYQSTLKGRKKNAAHQACYPTPIPCDFICSDDVKIKTCRHPLRWSLVMFHGYVTKWSAHMRWTITTSFKQSLTHPRRKYDRQFISTRKRVKIKRRCRALGWMQWLPNGNSTHRALGRRGTLKAQLSKALSGRASGTLQTARWVRLAVADKMRSRIHWIIDAAVFYSSSLVSVMKKNRPSSRPTNHLTNGVPCFRTRHVWYRSWIGLFIILKWSASRLIRSA